MNCEYFRQLRKELVGTKLQICISESGEHNKENFALPARGIHPAVVDEVCNFLEAGHMPIYILSKLRQKYKGTQTEKYLPTAS